MKKRIASKIIIAVLFMTCVVYIFCDDGGSEMIRNGVANVLDYDFEIKGIAQELGIEFDIFDDSISVGGDSVAYYKLPVNGKIVEDFDDISGYTKYHCEILLTVRAATNGEVSNIVEHENSCSVSVLNSHGYEITVDGLETVYVKYGQRVTLGQILGKLTNSGMAFVSAKKDGQICNTNILF